MSQEEVANFLASVRALDERTAREDAARLAKMEAGIAIGRAQQAKLSNLSLKDAPPKLPARPQAQQHRSDSADFSKLDRRERELSQQRELENARIRSSSRAEKFRTIQEQKRLYKERQASEHSMEDDRKSPDATLSVPAAGSPIVNVPSPLPSDTAKTTPPVPPRTRQVVTETRPKPQITSHREQSPEILDIPLINPVPRPSAEQYKPQESTPKESKPSWLVSALARNPAPEPAVRAKPSAPPSRGRSQQSEEPPKLPLRPKVVKVAPEPAPSDIAIGMDRLRRSANSSPQRFSRSPERGKEQPQETSFASPTLRKTRPSTMDKPRLTPQPKPELELKGPQTVLKPVERGFQPRQPDFTLKTDLRKISTKTEPKVEMAQVEMSPTSLRKSASQKERYTGADAYLERSPDSLRKSQSQKERYSGADAFVERSPESLKRAERAKRYTGADAFVEKPASALRPAQKRVVSAQKPTEALQRLKELRARASKPEARTPEKNTPSSNPVTAQPSRDSVVRVQTEPSFAGTLDGILSKNKTKFSESTPALSHAAEEKVEPEPGAASPAPLVHLSRSRTRGPKRRLPAAGRAGRAAPCMDAHTASVAKEQAVASLEVAKRDDDDLEAKKARQRRVASEKKRPPRPARQT